MRHANKVFSLTAKLATTIALAASTLGLTSFSSQAAEDYYTFKSVLSSGSANWCIDVPGADYQAAKHLAISGCSGKPNQTFGFEGGGTLTIGGYCLDGLAATRRQVPGAGDPVVIAECDGSDHQIWELQPFKNRQGVFAIASSDGFCVTVDGTTIGEGTPLVLAQCAELDTQGWVSNRTASAEPEYYIYSGRRYCWYDDGWHGGGWYWCGENFHEGIGWGGPIGWHWWHHHGHPHHPPHHPHPHPVPHPHPHHPPHHLHPHAVPHPHPHPVLHPHPHVTGHHTLHQAGPKTLQKK